MSGVNMKTTIHPIQNLGSTGARQALDNYTAVLDAVVTWGRSRLNDTKAPQSEAGIIDTVADKSRAQRRARKRTVKGLKHAARTAHPSPAHKRNKPTWLVAGLLAEAIVETIVIARTPHPARQAVPGSTGSN